MFLSDLSRLHGTNLAHGTPTKHMTEIILVRRNGDINAVHAVAPEVLEEYAEFLKSFLTREKGYRVTILLPGGARCAKARKHGVVRSAQAWAMSTLLKHDARDIAESMGLVNAHGNPNTRLAHALIDAGRQML